VSDDDEAFEAANQRSAFFRAALGLAHISIGFGELARALTTSSDRIWLP